MIELLSAGILGAACIAVWFVALGACARARVNLRFAAVLFAAPAVAALIVPAAAGAVALIVAAIAVAVLALAAFAGFEHRIPPMPATLGLMAVSLGGVASAMTGMTAFALAPSSIAAVAILVIAARQFARARHSSIQAMLSAMAILAANSCLALEGARSAQLLFSAVGLLGTALALSRVSDADVEQQRRGNLRRAVPVAEHG